MYQAPNAPQSIGGVLDNGFRLFRECFTQVFLFAVVTSLATAPASYLGPYIAANASPGLMGAVYLAIVGVVIVTLILTGAIAIRIDGVARGQPVPVGEALAIGARRAPAALGSGILLTLAIVAVPCIALIVLAAAGVSSPITFTAAAFLLFVFPASVIAVWLFFGPYAAIIDRLGPLTSLRYSRAITRGHWWRTTALITIIAIILLVVYMVVAIAAAVSAFSNPEALAAGPPWYIQWVVSPLLSAIAMPLSYALFLAIYYDLKLRHEGGDLAARIAAAA
jgi:hypothetical protein